MFVVYQKKCDILISHFCSVMRPTKALFCVWRYKCKQNPEFRFIPENTCPTTLREKGKTTRIPNQSQLQTCTSCNCLIFWIVQKCNKPQLIAIHGYFISIMGHSWLFKNIEDPSAAPQPQQVKPMRRPSEEKLRQPDRWPFRWSHSFSGCCSTGTSCGIRRCLQLIYDAYLHMCVYI